MSKRKLLLADDSMTIQKVVNLTFADEGIEVFTVGNGSLAIEKLSEIEPDLVLADVHMPGLTGYEVCEQIRMNPQFQNVPVMLLVGSFEPFDESEAKRVGANDYLTKPFQSIRQLIQKVTDLLGDSQSEMNGDSKNELSVVSANSNDASENYSSQNSSAATPTAAQNDAALSVHEMSFGDTALDDEMIETSSAGNLSGNFSDPILPSQPDSTNFGEIKTSSAEEILSSNETLASAEHAFSDELDPEMRQTEPLSYNDIQEMNSSMLAAPVESKKPEQWQNIEIEANTFDEPTAPSFTDAPALPSQNLDQNEFSGNSTEEFEMELDLPASQEDLSAASGVKIIEDEKIIPIETRSQQEKTAEFDAAPVNESAVNDNNPPELDLDEMNLLQIDDENPILDLQTEETTNNVSAVDLEVLPPMQDFSKSANNRLAQVASQAVSTMNMDFPPQVIEAIAQLVVEKLSDKVIEKIAWEIVPDRFDLIVRKQMEQRDR